MGGATTGPRAGARAILILALETSCDDTCAAVLSRDGRVLSNVVSSQAALHDRYGGVVPEVASRQHLRLVNSVVDTALRDAGAQLDAIRLVAATCGPGLIGALLIGVTTAKALAASKELPFVPVDHLQGHVAANFLLQDPIEPPFVCLIASGGHTLLALVEDHRSFRVLGQTLDDAAGEAFDKGARVLGLPYPGGVALDRLAKEGNPSVFSFPVGMRNEPDSLDFSYSGLKTALIYRVRQLEPRELAKQRANIAAGFQLAICRQLVDRARSALEQSGLRRLAVGGGVAANSQLRAMLAKLGEESEVEVRIPPPELCTDNAAMIAAAARFLEPIAYPAYLGFDAFAAAR